MNLYVVSSGDFHESASFVLARTRNRARYMYVHGSPCCEEQPYSDVRAKRLAGGLGGKWEERERIINGPDEDGYELVTLLGYRFRGEEDLDADV